MRLLQVLLREGKTARLRQLAEKVEPADLAGAFRLAGAADDAAFKQALAQIPTASRPAAVHTFHLASLQVADHDRVRRAHRLAGDVLKSGGGKGEVPRLRSVAAEPKTIADLFARFVSEGLLASENRWLSRDIVARRPGTLVGPIARSRYFAFTGSALLPARQLIADFASNAFEIHSFGRIGPVEAINVKGPGTRGTERFYVHHEGVGGKELRLLGVPGMPQFLAPAVLRAVDAGRVDQARRLLDWAAGDPAASKSGNFVGLQMSRFWTRGQRGDRRRIRLAAAGLLVPLDPDRSLKIFARECPPSGELAEPCRMARVAALVGARRFGEADELARGLALAPDPLFLSMKALHLIHAGTWTELDQLAAQAHPAEMEQTIQYYVALAWVARGQPARARAIADALRAGPAWRSGMLNNIAFLYLFTGAGAADLKGIVPDLERSTRDAPGIHKQHTLATYYAVLGRDRDARDALRQAAQVHGRAGAADQLVLGRIAAEAGLTDVARRAYQEAIDDKESSKSPHSSSGLARRWLAELSVKN